MNSTRQTNINTKCPGLCSSQDWPGTSNKWSVWFLVRCQNWQTILLTVGTIGKKDNQHLWFYLVFSREQNCISALIKIKWGAVVSMCHSDWRLCGQFRILHSFKIVTLFSLVSSLPVWFLVKPCWTFVITTCFASDILVKSSLYY